MRDVECHRRVAKADRDSGRDYASRTKADSASSDGSRPDETPPPHLRFAATPPREMHKPPEKCEHFSELQLLYTKCESDKRIGVCCGSNGARC